MNINVKHLAQLSNLQIEERAIPAIKKDLSALVELVNHFPLDLPQDDLLADENDKMELREDTVQPSLSREQALANAPQKQAGCIVVPQTV